MSQEVAFNRWLKLRRSALDLTQWDLAERVGCSREAIQKIEAGTRRPSKQIAELLLAGLDIPAEQQAAFVRWARLGPEAAPPDLALAFATATPVESVKSAPPSNLPAPLTSLIGRDEEVEAVRRSLLRDEVRLLTLVGPPVDPLFSPAGRYCDCVEDEERCPASGTDGVHAFGIDSEEGLVVILQEVARLLTYSAGRRSGSSQLLC